jgi:hypothetical protein
VEGVVLDFAGLFSNLLPSPSHVALSGVGLAHTETDGEFPIQFGVGHEEIAAVVQPLH